MAWVCGWYYWYALEAMQEEWMNESRNRSFEFCWIIYLRFDWIDFCILSQWIFLNTIFSSRLQPTMTFCWVVCENKLSPYDFQTAWYWYCIILVYLSTLSFLLFPFCFSFYGWFEFSHRPIPYLLHFFLFGLLFILRF